MILIFGSQCVFALVLNTSKRGFLSMSFPLGNIVPKTRFVSQLFPNKVKIIFLTKKSVQSRPGDARSSKDLSCESCGCY